MFSTQLPRFTCGVEFEIKSCGLEGEEESCSHVKASESLSCLLPNISRSLVLIRHFISSPGAVLFTEAYYNSLSKTIRSKRSKKQSGVVSEAVVKRDCLNQIKKWILSCCSNSNRSFLEKHLHIIELGKESITANYITESLDYTMGVLLTHAGWLRSGGNRFIQGIFQQQEQTKQNKQLTSILDAMSIRLHLNLDSKGEPNQLQLEICPFFLRHRELDAGTLEIIKHGPGANDDEETTISLLPGLNLVEVVEMYDRVSTNDLISPTGAPVCSLSEIWLAKHGINLLPHTPLVLIRDKHMGEVKVPVSIYNPSINSLCMYIYIYIYIQREILFVIVDM